MDSFRPLGTVFTIAGVIPEVRTPVESVPGSMENLLQSNATAFVSDPAKKFSTLAPTARSLQRSVISYNADRTASGFTSSRLFLADSLSEPAVTDKSTMATFSEWLGIQQADPLDAIFTLETVKSIFDTKAQDILRNKFQHGLRVDDLENLRCLYANLKIYILQKPGLREGTRLTIEKLCQDYDLSFVTHPQIRITRASQRPHVIVPDAFDAKQAMFLLRKANTDPEVAVEILLALTRNFLTSGQDQAASDLVFGTETDSTEKTSYIANFTYRVFPLFTPEERRRLTHSLCDPEDYAVLCRIAFETNSNRPREKSILALRLAGALLPAAGEEPVLFTTVLECLLKNDNAHSAGEWLLLDAIVYGGATLSQTAERAYRNIPEKRTDWNEGHLLYGMHSVRMNHNGTLPEAHETVEMRAYRLLGLIFEAKTAIQGIAALQNLATLLPKLGREERGKIILKLVAIHREKRIDKTEAEEFFRIFSTHRNRIFADDAEQLARYLMNLRPFKKPEVVLHRSTYAGLWSENILITSDNAALYQSELRTMVAARDEMSFSALLLLMKSNSVNCDPISLDGFDFSDLNMGEGNLFGMDFRGATGWEKFIMYKNLDPTTITALRSLGVDDFTTCGALLGLNQQSVRILKGTTINPRQMEWLVKQNINAISGVTLAKGEYEARIFEQIRLLDCQTKDVRLTSTRFAISRAVFQNLRTGGKMDFSEVMAFSGNSKEGWKGEDFSGLTLGLSQMLHLKLKDFHFKNVTFQPGNYSSFDFRGCVFENCDVTGISGGKIDKAAFVSLKAAGKRDFSGFEFTISGSNFDSHDLMGIIIGPKQLEFLSADIRFFVDVTFVFGVYDVFHFTRAQFSNCNMTGVRFPTGAKLGLPLIRQMQNDGQSDFSQYEYEGEMDDFVMMQLQELGIKINSGTIPVTVSNATAQFWDDIALTPQQAKHLLILGKSHFSRVSLQKIKHELDGILDRMKHFMKTISMPTGWETERCQFALVNFEEYIRFSEIHDTSTVQNIEWFGRNIKSIFGEAYPPPRTFTQSQHIGNDACELILFLRKSDFSDDVNHANEVLEEFERFRNKINEQWTPLLQRIDALVARAWQQHDRYHSARASALYSWEYSRRQYKNESCAGDM